MNGQQWRKLGYMTIYREGLVYLHRPQSDVTLVIANNHGEWMNYDDVNKSPWMSVEAPADFAAIAEACYCDPQHLTGPCDFCSSKRTAGYPHSVEGVPCHIHYAESDKLMN